MTNQGRSHDFDHGPPGIEIPGYTYAAVANATLQGKKAGTPSGRRAATAAQNVAGDFNPRWAGSQGFRRAACCLTIHFGLALLSTAALAEEKPQPPPVGIVEKRAAQANVLTATLPGPIFDVEAMPAALGGGLLVLSATSSEREAPRTLHRVAAGQKQPELLLTGLPHGLKDLTLFRGEVLVGEPGRITRLRREPWALETWLERPGLDLGLLESRALLRPERLIVPEVGNLATFTFDVGGKPIAIADKPLPISARRSRSGFDLRTPPLTLLDDGRIVVGPDAVGKTRLKSAFGDPSGDLLDAWSRLPGAETVEVARAASLDGQAALLILSVGAEQLNLFEKLSLRVLPLAGDRTQAGLGSSFSVETESRRWFEPDLHVDDFDGDGKTDLLLIQPEGMSGSDLVLELFLGRGKGRFDKRSRSVKLDAPENSWTFGPDFDGDSRPDLIIASKESLSVHRGFSKAATLIEKTPFRRLEIGDAQALIVVTIGDRGADVDSAQEAAPRVLELDSDQMPEIVLVGLDQSRGQVTIVDWR